MALCAAAKMNAVGANVWRPAIRAHLATIDFCDAMVGRLLAPLRLIAGARQHDHLLLELSRFEFQHSPQSKRS